jgi:4-hydroxybenzoate polyprenyltransferase
LIGVKSAALWLGKETRPWVCAFFLLALPFIDLAGIMAGASIIFHIAIAAAAVHAAWQLSRLNIDDPDNCLKLFRSNRDFGLIIFAGALCDSIAAGALSP